TVRGRSRGPAYGSRWRYRASRCPRATNRHRLPVHQPKAPLDAFDHQVANVAAVDAPSRRHPRDRLAVAAVESEGDTHPLAIVAADFEPVGAPANVRPVDRDTAVMPPLDAVAGVALEQKAVRFHDPVHALDIHRSAAFVAATSPDQCVHSAIAVSR